MNPERKRDPYFDNLKGILVYLVFAGHCLSLYKSGNPICNYLFHIIYAFHMPLFLYISGYFSKNLVKSAQSAYEALILPAIPFELAYFALHWVTNADNFEPFLTPIFAYWYLFVLFGYRVLMPYMAKLRFMTPLAFVLALGVGFNSQIGEYMTLSRFFCLLPFFLLGYYTNRETMDKLRNLNGAVSFLMGAAAAMALAVVMLSNIIELDFTLAAPYEDVYGLAGRVFQFALAILFSMAALRFTPRKESFLTRIGQRTLQIYLLNFYAVTAIQMVNPFAAQNGLNAALMLIVPAVGTVVMATPLVDVPYNLLMRITRAVLLKPEESEE